jgi:hypothetical protein
MSTHVAVVIGAGGALGRATAAVAFLRVAVGQVSTTSTRPSSTARSTT